MRKLITVLLMFASMGIHAGGSWLINEFQYDPDPSNGDANGDGTSSTTQDEFVEIYNDTGADVDISGWTLSDGVSVRHIFPANSVVLNQCSIVVFGGGTPTGFFGGSLAQTASTSSLSLNNSGDSMALNDGISDVAVALYVDNQGDDQSLTLDPDITGLTFVPHSTATGSSTLFSPGAMIDGTQFAGCPTVVDTAPEVSETNPVDSAVGVSIDSNITISFNEAVDVTLSGVTVTCDAVGQTISGLPFSGDELVIDPDVSLPFEANCDVVVLAAEVTDQDGTVDNMVADYNFSFTVETEIESQIDLIVNEYQADPDATNDDANGDGTADTSEDEFIEIYNNGPNPVDISGWTISDAVELRHTFAASTLLDSCEAIVIFGGGTPTGTFGGSVTDIASEGSLGLNNGGDSIILNDGNTDRINLSFGSSGTNESYTLDPDITGSSFVGHAGATGSSGSLFSPGTQINGTAFVPCGSTPTPPRVDATIPANNDVGVALNTDIVIDFSEAIDATINAATLTCGVDTISFSGLPVSNVSQVTLNPTADLPNGTSCTLELIATDITDLDDTPDELDGNSDGTGGDNFSMQFFAGTPQVEIFEIQGAGMASVFNGQTVTTSDNIVTALDTNGFYMQTPDARDDADTMTSNGIFVFTGSPVPVAVGDQVDLTGEVVEFFDLTEFTNPNDYVLSIDSTNNTLPTAILLDNSFPPTDPTLFPCVDEVLEYECVEGMLFDMPQGFISAASVSFFGANRDDQMVSAGTSRAFREPGIDYPGIPGLPEFDGNPELLEMDVDALGLDLAANSYAAGSEVAISGVFGFDFGEYEIWPSSIQVINENVIPAAVRDALPDEVTIGSANLFRLFNDVDDPGSEDDDQIEDPLVYAMRLQKLANYFINDMKSPTIIGLQEIENSDVLTDLIAAITFAGGPAYTADLVEGNDQGGIDVAYLYQTALLSNVTVTQLGAAELNTFDNSLLHDRPPLRLEADVAVNLDTMSLNVLVVHMRSRGGIDDVSDGERVRSKRLQQANSVALMINDIVNEAPNKALYVIGDYNAFEFTDGYVDVIGQITGDAIDADNLLWEEPLFVNAPLTQAVQTLTATEQYSFIFRGSAQILDNAIMNDIGLMNFLEMQFVRGQSDASINFEDDDMTSLRSTDHDGFVLYVIQNDDLIFRHGFQ